MFKKKGKGKQVEDDQKFVVQLGNLRQVPDFFYSVSDKLVLCHTDFPLFSFLPIDNLANI